MAKTSAAIIEVVGADKSEIPKSKKYVKKNTGDAKPPVVKRRIETAKEKINISKGILDEGFKYLYFVKNETKMYTATMKPEI